MGDYRITIDIVGGHGCARNVKPPQPGAPFHIRYARCNSLSCIDCRTQEFVEMIRTKSWGDVRKATIEHWPKRMLLQDGSYVERTPENGGDPGPVDDLLAGTRDKQFKG